MQLHLNKECIYPMHYPHGELSLLYLSSTLHQCISRISEHSKQLSIQTPYIFFRYTRIMEKDPCRGLYT